MLDTFFPVRTLEHDIATDLARYCAQKSLGQMFTLPALHHILYGPGGIRKDNQHEVRTGALSRALHEMISYGVFIPGRKSNPLSRITPYFFNIEEAQHYYL